MRNPELFKDIRIGIQYWHLGDHFLVQRSFQRVERTLKKRGLTWNDYYSKIPFDERREIGFEERNSVNGLFTFPPRTLILGQTEEFVQVPLDKLYHMHDHFVSQETGLILPIRTHANAPLIQPSSVGYQTYEIYNESSCPITVMVKDLVCPADILPLDRASEGRNGSNHVGLQQKGEIFVGKIKIS